MIERKRANGQIQRATDVYSVVQKRIDAANEGLPDSSCAYLARLAQWDLVSHGFQTNTVEQQAAS
jgi:hypothetical protein